MSAVQTQNTKRIRLKLTGLATIFVVAGGLVAFPAQAETHDARAAFQLLRAGDEGHADEDGCEDMWRYACARARELNRTPEQELAVTADRALDFLVKRATAAGYLGKLKESLPLSFYELSWSGTFKNLRKQLKENPKKTGEEIRDYFEENSYTPVMIFLSKIQKYDLMEIQPNEQERKIRSSNEQRIALAKRVFNTLADKMSPAEFEEFLSAYVQDDLSFRTLNRLFEIGEKNEPDFAAKFKDLVPEAERTAAAEDFTRIQTLATQISVLHRTLADPSVIPKIALAWPPASVRERAGEGVGKWASVFLAGNDRFSNEQGDIMMVRARATAPFRYFRVMAHEYGHAIDFKAAGEDFKKFLGELETCLSEAMLPSKPDLAHMREFKADWYSTEIFALHLKRSAMTAAQKREAAMEAAIVSCQQPPKLQEGYEALAYSHPDPSERTNKIYMAHPYIREILGCPATLPARMRYCSF